MKRYMIHCCPGTGGLFLSTVFAQIMGIDVKAKFSTSGNAHDMGKGNWKGADAICFIGDHWDINYRPGSELYYSHVVCDDFFVDNPDINLVMITAAPCYYRKITELYVKKAWPDIWTKEEYDKWAGPDYPPYAPDNIPNSEIIVNDLIDDFEKTRTAAWFDLNQTLKPIHTVDFEDVMGISGSSLVEIVENIIGNRASQATKNYVLEYQQMNKGLYFDV